jgi:8-oxo-dGTP pyrophosphatase MutT (NUDIX family)
MRSARGPDPPPGRGTAARDAAYRVAYRLGYLLLWLWWGLRRPDHQGAVVAVWLDGHVLMLRPSYRRSFDFPGGSIDRGETPLAAACRELREEVGIAAPAEALTFARQVVVWRDNRRDHVSIFELRLAAAPVLRLDGREIVDAAFMRPEAALALPVSPFVRAYLERPAMS